LQPEAKIKHVKAKSKKHVRKSGVVEIMAQVSRTRVAIAVAVCSCLRVKQRSDGETDDVRPADKVA
jgi:hypothetical protein